MLTVVSTVDTRTVEVTFTMGGKPQLVATGPLTGPALAGRFEAPGYGWRFVWAPTAATPEWDWHADPAPTPASG